MALDQIIDLLQLAARPGEAPNLSESLSKEAFNHGRPDEAGGSGHQHALVSSIDDFVHAHLSKGSENSFWGKAFDGGQSRYRGVFKLNEKEFWWSRKVSNTSSSRLRE